MVQPQPDVSRLKVPEQDLPHLTVGSDNPKKLQTWVDSLPLVNMGESARQLYLYIQELNRLQLDSKTRLQLLEVVRPAILHVCVSLRKHYLGQPLVLPEKARRVASLAQALQTHLANGYKLVAVRGSRKLKDKVVRKAVALSIHRALTALADNLLRCCQLYSPYPRNLWVELHQLYRLAESLQLQDEAVDDGEQLSTVAQVYGGALLLATAKPNQLRQQELAALFDAARQWGAQISIKAASAGDDLFVFDLASDRPPLYRTHASQASDSCRYIDAGKLIDGLNGWLNGQQGRGLSVPTGINKNLVGHLTQVWGMLTERAFQRLQESGEMQVCFGLAASHYFLAGETPFETLLKGKQMQVLQGQEEANPFLRNIQNHQKKKQQQADPWAASYRVDDLPGESINMTASNHSAPSETVAPERHRCQKVNASPGGYCLAWQGNTPPLMRTGELIALRDRDDARWALAVIRWVNQLANHGAHFGVELLAPGAEPVAAKALKKQGESGDYMRALLVPELLAVGQPMTLIVPAVGFAEGGKVEMLVAGEIQRLQLLRSSLSTGGFSQYPFRELGGNAGHGEAAESNEGELDSIWTTL